MIKQLLLLATSVLLSTYYFLNKLPDDQAHIYFCDVGQGDGALIVHQNYEIVIDGGPNDKISLCLQRFMPAGDNTLEVVIASHADSDHITGLINVLKNYHVQAIYTEAYGKNTATWEKFRASVAADYQQGSKIIEPKSGETITFDPFLSALFISPKEQRGSLDVFLKPQTETQLSAYYAKEAQEYSTENNESIALILTIQRVKIAFMSDLEVPAELAVTTPGLLQHINVLKAGHHGSKTSFSLKLYDVWQPEDVVLSVGKKNSYGFPNPEVIADLQRRKIAIWRTDQSGTVELLTNGDTYSWNTYSDY